MAISRRMFLKSGTLTALAAGVALNFKQLALGQRRGGGQAFPIPLQAQQQPTFMFTRATFEHYVGDFFQAPNARGAMVGLELLSVTQYNPSPNTRLSTGSARGTDSFSLMFRADGSLPQFTSLHIVSHPRLGEFALFLKPVEQNGVRMYEAVFNHI